MRIYTELESFQAKKPVVTIGVFDGVHKGHKAIISNLVNRATEIGGESVVVTLWPHPRIVLKKDVENLRLLNCLEEKKWLLEKQQIDHLVILPFTEELSRLKACDFIKDILVDKIGVEHLLIGYDHHFGKGGKGNFRDVEACSAKYNFQVERLDAKSEEGTEISSTVIRNALLDGNLKKANQYLGYFYFIMGRVIGGNRIGQKIGFPTANIEPHDPYKLIPKDGVYAIKANPENKTLKGMLNIGYRPTVGGQRNKVSIETHLFDFDEDIYNKEITIHMIQRIRAEKKFNHVDELVEQLKVDKESSLQILSDTSNS
ncbi:MAG: riboflavin biosynthesis protein RibF [Bacteroidales bacterium]|nr:riboflavin biosynthesis protein RibF [Bacteroidales bacterium]MBS3776979.1 riboflavin biosynthesis protein RibF [Bacteroidales bacterium]